MLAFLFCRQIPVDVVEELNQSEMIPHEVLGAHSLSWSDPIYCGLRSGTVYQ